MQCVCLSLIFRVLCLFGILSCVCTGAYLARVKDVPSYLSSGEIHVVST